MAPQGCKEGLSTEPGYVERLAQWEVLLLAVNNNITVIVFSVPQYEAQNIALPVDRSWEIRHHLKTGGALL